MGELGVVARYLYWSDRRVRSILDDNGLKLPGDRQAKLTTPDLRGALPKVELTRNSAAATKVDLAREVESAIGLRAVSNFVTPGPVGFARGAGRVVFGEFINHSAPERAVFYTEVEAPDGKVAVCLFGSLDNFADFVMDAGALHRRGWTSSNAFEIEHFISTRKLARSGDGLIRDEQELAEEAFKVATGQGMTAADTDTYFAWRRGHTFGDTSGRAEWFAEVFVDQPLENPLLVESTGCTRVIVGAPLWLRTPAPEDYRLFARHEWNDLEAAGGAYVAVSRAGLPTRIRRRLRGFLQKSGWMDE